MATAPELHGNSSSGSGGSNSSSNHNNISITPLYGGKSETGVCVLLEIGGARILMDCGATVPMDYAYLRQVTADLVKSGGVDAIIISHADMHHVGALPIIAGKNGLAGVPVVGTLPVRRFAQLLLYDFVLNMKMEGDSVSKTNYSFDDIDCAFGNFVELRYSQTIHLPHRSAEDPQRQHITICAVSAGRTIGGAMWKITCGASEIVYAVDLNARRDEMVLTAVGEDLLQSSLSSSPTVLITDATSATRGSTATGGALRKKKEKDESPQMLELILKTLREGGNVLLPCESAGRLLELLQLLSKFWIDEKLGMYHLVYLSHMAHNVLEYAQSQLEWMSESLTKKFYDGDANPFQLPRVKVATDVSTIDRKYQGPKVVLATDASLNYGLSKELLLKWGGDRRCRVIFTDSTDLGAASSHLLKLSQQPPIIASVMMPVRVNLAGQELADYQQEQERLRRAKEEEQQQKRRQEELSLFQGGKDIEIEEDDAAEEGAQSTHEQLRKRYKTSSKMSLLTQHFVMFEKTEANVSVDKFGMSIDDLDFKDIVSAESKWNMRDKNDKSSTTVESNAPVQKIEKKRTEERHHTPDTAVDAHPWKIISTTQKMQFTCEFKHFALGGRMDVKGTKSFLRKIAPSKVCLVRGSESDCQAMIALARSCEIGDVYAPTNGQQVNIVVSMQKLHLQIPRRLVPSNMKSIKSIASSTTDANAPTCTVCLLDGQVQAMDLAGSHIVRYMGKTVVDNGNSETDSGGDDETTPLVIRDETLGVISMGEVALSALKKQLDAAGVHTEIRVVSSGAVLVCGDQVLIRKDNNNFLIEGPPVPAFFEARKALYQQFAFI